MGHSKLVVMLAQILIQARSHERQTLSTLLAHDDETQALQVGAQIVGRPRQVQHYPPVSPLAQADKLVVLPNDLTRTAREVERKRRLVGTEVVDVEDKLLREVLCVAPDDPADTRVDEAVLVAGDVDGGDLWQAEVPEQAGVDKGGDEAARCGIDVDVYIDVALNQEVVNGFDVFVLAGVRGAENGA